MQEFVVIQQVLNHIQPLPIFERHIWALGDLPLHHKDPFDRILIAQAMVEDLQLVTADPVFTQYPVKLFK